MTQSRDVNVLYTNLNIVLFVIKSNLFVFYIKITLYKDIIIVKKRYKKIITKM